MSHADEVITNVNRRRVLARAHEDSFTVAWDYPGRTLLEVRILRSCEWPAASADDGSAEGQELVYEDVTGSFRDAGLRPDVPYFYTVFARHPGRSGCAGESTPPAGRGGRREAARALAPARHRRPGAAAGRSCGRRRRHDQGRRQAAPQPPRRPLPLPRPRPTRQSPPSSRGPARPSRRPRRGADPPASRPATASSTTGRRRRPRTSTKSGRSSARTVGSRSRPTTPPSTASARARSARSRWTSSLRPPR